MLLKNETKRVRLVAIDPTGERKSKTLTLYDATPAEAIEMVREAAIQRIRGRQVRKSKATDAP